jgi:hypothetical protein
MSDDFIKNLATNIKPVVPTPPPGIRSLAWMAAAILCVGAGVSLVGLRPDLSESFREPFFWLESLAILLVACIAIAAAFVLSVPGRESSPLTKWLVGIPLAIWMAQMTGRFVFESHDISPYFWSGYGCANEIVALGILPGILMFYMIKRAAPTNLGLTGALGALAVASISALGTQFTCSSSAPSHLLAFHFVPVLAVGAVGIFLGKKFLRW